MTTLKFNLNPELDNAVLYWLNWQHNIAFDPSEAYTISNIIKVTLLYRIPIPSPYGLEEIHTMIRVYLDDELGYIDLLCINRAGQNDTIMVCADTHWTIIKGAN